MRKDIHVIFPPYMQKYNHVQILNGNGYNGWVWFVVPLRVCGYHGNGEKQLMVVEEVGHFQ